MQPTRRKDGRRRAADSASLAGRALKVVKDQPVTGGLRAILVSGIVTAMLAVSPQSATQENIHFAPADRVSVRKMADVPPIELVAGVQVRTVVGATGSVSIAQFDPGAGFSRHHHSPEQADIGLAGEINMTLDESVEALRPGFAVVVPPDVPHAITNQGRELGTVLEFHTVRRIDLVPPRPSVDFPASAKPARPERQLLVEPMDRPVRESPFSAYWLRGTSCLVAWRRMASGSAVVELRAGAVERFAYVVRGQILLKSGATNEYVEANALIVIPSRAAVTIQAVGPEMAAVAEFVPARSMQ